MGIGNFNESSKSEVCKHLSVIDFLSHTTRNARRDGIKLGLLFAVLCAERYGSV